MQKNAPERTISIYKNKKVSCGGLWEGVNPQPVPHISKLGYACPISQCHGPTVLTVIHKSNSNRILQLYTYVAEAHGLSIGGVGTPVCLCGRVP